MYETHVTHGTKQTRHKIHLEFHSWSYDSFVASQRNQSFISLACLWRKSSLKKVKKWGH